MLATDQLALIVSSFSLLFTVYVFTRQRRIAALFDKPRLVCTISSVRDSQVKMLVKNETSTYLERIAVYAFVLDDKAFLSRNIYAGFIRIRFFFSIRRRIIPIKGPVVFEIETPDLRAGGSTVLTVQDQRFAESVTLDVSRMRRTFLVYCCTSPRGRFRFNRTAVDDSRTTS